MVTTERQATRRTLMPTLAECLAYFCATSACLACAFGVNFNERSTSIFRFVAQLIKEARPSGIINGLRKHPARKPFSVQIFNGNKTVVVDNRSAQVVMEIRPLISDVSVSPLQQQNSLAPPITTLLSSGNLSLCSPKLSLSGLEPAGIVNFGTIGKGSERSQTNIYSNLFFTLWQRLRLALNSKAGEPSISLALNSQRFNYTFNWAVKFYFNVSDFREPKLGPVQSLSDLTKRDAVISLAGLKSWVARFLSSLHSPEECFEGEFDALQYVLKCLSVYLCDVITNLFDFCELKVLVKEGNGLAVEPPSVTSFLKCSVIEFGAPLKGFIQDSRLAFSWIKPKLVNLVGHTSAYFTTA